MERIKKIFCGHKGIVATIVFTLIGVALIIGFVVPRYTDNMGGTHSWLSGSTIKFVNYWLEDGAKNLKFTNYESPASIEFNELDDRTPYLSYPSGETFFVFIFAKILGRSQISVSFLHKFQMIMFVIEALLLAGFVYYFLSRTIKLKKELGKIVISVLTAMLWVLLPTCSYYLLNVYYSDQCVILWVMAIILVEYLYRTSEKKKNTILKVIRSIIVFSGLLIDYYFWILTFFLFVAEIWNVCLTKRKGERKKEIISILLWFGIPAILAVLLFYIQLIQTNDWFKIMTGKFAMRVVGRENDTLDWELATIGKNFANAFSLDAVMINYLLWIFAGIAIISLVLMTSKKKFKSLVTNPGISIVFFSIVAIVVQIYFLKQHSAIHEFSMIKVGWAVAILPILISLVITYAFGGAPNTSFHFFNKKIGAFSSVYAISFLMVCAVVGAPFSAIKFVNDRVEIVKYDFEEMVDENTDYNDVLFSFSKEIVMNPPQSLAISNKRIYKIKEVKDIEEKFPDLSSEAVKVLVVEKTAELDKEKKAQQDCLVKNADVRIETGSYYLYDLKNINKCIKE